MKVVLDVNVLVSALANQSGTMRSILVEWSAGSFDIVLSEHIVTTAERVLAKPFWVTHTHHVHMATELSRIRDIAKMVEPAPCVHGIAEDDEDDIILATAVAAIADYLVTGDRYLLDLRSYGGIPIVNARDFLNVLLNDPYLE